MLFEEKALLGEEVFKNWIGKFNKPQAFIMIFEEKAFKKFKKLKKK